ncbi:amidohydrolase/deacetylase family metallohydrolase [Companilactobacillus alimentarius]|uniref:amidohydrolase/deacetylase family metallohydrolase n=1 Tax=Companilactobacillus alimentarius TaxID=1602 RepID=UPI0028B7D1D4|nr:amidohydrolase/deacetylase family metallohydrolase [Companilactobacillus alimentarius]MDT6952609.1 amidohydrolase/deacetylase family metallohydrolase [Companilactobacillus alimentarius]
MEDLYIKNGKTERNQPIEITITDGKITAVDSKLAGITANKTIDLKNKSYVTPGWIDDHVHSYEKLDLYYDDPDKDGYLTGVTTVIDAGSTGADNIRDFYKITRGKKTNVLAMINISKTGILAQDELGDITRVQKKPLYDAVQELQNFIVGIKVRESHSVVVDNDVKPLLEAKRFQAQLGLPIMVHVGANPPELKYVLDSMSRGDILTHAYNGKPNGMIDKNGHVEDFALDAYDRGVIFDVGHGTDSFNFRTGEIARDEGIVPKSVSTDIYHKNRANGPVYDMATTLEKMLLIGYSLPEVIRMVTWAPADNFHLQSKGSLRPGYDGDLTIFNIEKGSKVLTDSNGNQKTTDTLIKPIYSVIAGNEYSIGER